MLHQPSIDSILRAEALAKRFVPDAEVEILFTGASDASSWTYVAAKTIAPTPEKAKRAVEIVLKETAEGRRAVIRVPPMSILHRDFEAETSVGKGYVRFGFKDEPGEWEYPSVPSVLEFSDALNARK